MHSSVHHLFLSHSLRLISTEPTANLLIVSIMSMGVFSNNGVKKGSVYSLAHITFVVEGLIIKSDI